MSNQPDGHAGPHQITAVFGSAEDMQDAAGRLSMSGFDRADLSLPAGDGSLGERSRPAATEEDARQARTLGASTAAAVAAIAAAGVTVATGGAAAPAVAAAVVAGGAAGGATFAVHGAADKSEQQDRDSRAAAGSLTLTVRPKSAAKQL